jgi:NAD+ kinase
MRIAIIGKPIKPEALPFIRELLEALDARGAEVRILDSFRQQLLQQNFVLPSSMGSFHRGDSLDGTDFVFSIGGDGTLLETVTYVGRLQIPIVGINTGRLGFLANVPKEQVSAALSALYRGHYTFDDRTLIKLDSEVPLFDGLNFALNEFSILKRDSSSMIVVHTYIDGEYLNSYWADGLVVSTPTGSTGYSLSCGGPVVLPQSSNFVISPVCPHNLNVRPMVVSDRSVISFEVEGRNNNFMVSLDSRSEAVDVSVQLAVRKEDFSARLVKLNNADFLATLRTKLNWGLDKRNYSG